jgi:hypothetical protein
MSQTDRPQVYTESARNFIRVASDKANVLHAYLRQRCVVCDPPDPCETGIAVIALGRGMEVKTVQALLDGWRPVK